MNKKKSIGNNIDSENSVNKSIKKVFLHMGMDKTATTSIQASIIQNEKQLNDLDIFCLFINRKESDKFAFDILYDQDKKDIYDRFIDKLKDSKSSIMLYSHEVMCYYKKEQMTFLRNMIESIGENITIKIIYSTREKSSYFVSGVQERIKSLNPSKSGFSNIYKTRLQNVIDVFGKDNIIIYKFEDAVSHEYGPVGRFLEALGLSQCSISKLDIIRNNEAISDKTIEILKYFIKFMDKYGYLEKDRLVNDVQQLYSISGNKFFLPAGEVETMLEEGKNDTIWLRDTFNIDYCNSRYEPKESDLIYDQVFFDDIIKIYNNLSRIMKKLLYEFLKEKQNSGAEDKSIILKLIKWIEQNDKDLIDLDIIDIIDSDMEKKDKDYSSLKRFFAKHGLNQDFDIADFYRDLALFCEEHNQLGSAYYFMRIAKAYRQNGPHLNRKIKEYKNRLK